MSNSGGAGRGEDGPGHQNPHPEAGPISNSGGAGRGGDGPALQNPHPEVGAIDDGGAVGRGRGGRGRGGRGRGGRGGGGRGRGVPAIQTPYPDLAAWTNHGHNHPTEVQMPVPDNVNCPQKMIIISKVVNGLPTNWHLLKGELVPNFNIASCNSPHGYAVVELDNSDHLFACLHPFHYHKEHISQEHTSQFPEFTAYVIRPDMVPRRFEGVLTTGIAGITLRGFSTRHMDRVGHARYIKNDPINPSNSIHAEGGIYKYD